VLDGRPGLSSPRYGRGVPPIDRLVAFAVTAAVVIAIPGPSVLFIVGRALAAGRRTALLSVLGNALGEYAQVAAVAFGIGALAERSVAVLTAIKLVGGAYLVYLGVRTFLRRRESLSVPTGGDGQLPPPERWALVRGAFVGVTNPKTVIFLAAILPQFVARASGHVTVQILVLGLVFSAIALVSDSAWALGAHGFRSWFAKSPSRLEVVHGSGGIAIAAVGVVLLLAGRKD
jgi:threonine/homoserine/homoserine lactone efflux protein